MKVISKFKDYYDFVSQPDDIVVFQRERLPFYGSEEQPKFEISKTDYYKLRQMVNSVHLLQGYNSKGHFGVLFLANIGYPFFVENYTNRHIYTSEELLSENVIMKGFQKPFIPTAKELNKVFMPKDKNKINSFLKEPILYTNLSEYIVNVKLTEYGFNKVLSPSQAYQEIYNFLAELKPEPTMPSNPDDMSRYEARGFDMKTSFRNIK